MRLDWYTKMVLTGIGVLLGMLVLGRGRMPGEVRGQGAGPAAGAFDNVEMVACPTAGFILFDKRTGTFCAYDMEVVKGALQFTKAAPAGHIVAVGAEVQKVP